jgi:hypothetical protein
MTRTKILFWLPAGAVVLGLSCAPVDDPPAKELPSLPAAGTDGPERSATLPMPPSGLKERVEAALAHVHERDVLTTHSFWTVFHCILGTGPDATLLDPLTNRRVNAIEYIRTGGEVRGLEFIPTPDGLDVRTGPQFVGQGHQDQFVAEMAQWGLPADTKFMVRGREYTFADFVHHTQARARVTANQELSWAIVVIGQYVGTDIGWTNAAGEKLRFEDLVRYELDQPIDGAACGGTHRLFGLTWAYHLHLRKGGQTTGVWKDVADKTAHYHEVARKLQNSDGSFSTKYLSGPGNARDAQLRIGTTGHVLEWLALSLSDGELRAPWVQEAASALSLMILDNQGMPIEGGALYHAAHGLHIYHDRVFGPSAGERRGPLIPLPPETVSKPPLGGALRP